MTKRPNRRMIALIAVPAILVVGAGTALAIAPTLTNTTGTTQSSFAAATDSNPVTYTSSTFTTAAKVDVTSAGGETIVVRFSAESACYGGTGYCAAKILVDGTEADPVTAKDFAFDSTNTNTATIKSTASHSMERVIPNVSMGATATVEVQVAMVGANVMQRLDDWTLTAYSIAP